MTSRLMEFTGRPLLVGLCGAQGSGKSILAKLLAQRMTTAGVKAATLSLDDLYFTKVHRARIAQDVHPLLLSRGTPGTHDVMLGMNILDAVNAGHPVLLPRFDKARDDRAPRSEWHSTPSGLQVLFFEGWCVGAEPQLETALHVPVNRLEREEDADGRWRSYVNEALAGPYQTLFARLDRLILLAAPSFDIVRRWRGQQEAELRRLSPQGEGVMSEAALERFIEHYERLTRHILEKMPGRADLVLRLSPEREVLSVERR